MLVCPVRGCGLPLVSEERQVVCPRRHSFDIARTGYINLLQPQDRRSKEPGDTELALTARRRLHDSCVTQPLLRAIAKLLDASPDECGAWTARNADPAWAGKFLSEWCRQVMLSRIEPMKQVARTLRRHRNLIGSASWVVAGNAADAITKELK